MPEAGPHPVEVPHPLEMEGLHQIEADVRAKIADRLRGAPTTHLYLTDDESDQGEPAPAATRCKNPGVSGKIRTVDTTVVRSVMWLNEVVYSPIAQPIMYEHISPMAFVDGSITIMGREPLPIKKLMLAHLQELMKYE